MQLTLYNLYQKMLAHMGATNWWPADSKQQIIIEAILIQNTTELNATRASQLIKTASNYDLQVLVSMPKENLEELVRPAGFMKNKSKAIQEVASWYLAHNENPTKIVQQYGSSLRKVLLSLHGVGPETADVLMAYIFDQPQFIADKYARTLFTQLGINDLTDYKSLARLLTKLPQPFTFADAQEFHGLIDEFGKQYFHPVEEFQKSFLAGDQLILK
ncbi:endonuclease III domain-containing protein [Streptococcus gallolyticus]|uniref:DNA-3-methyladenine glycosylase III n=1 Tax=Streptococcus gallolyticus TaxID=315405 RepID=A0A1H9M2L6_9STRE|nr:deoxyribonuclease I [Streptococcus gallolyticus]SER17940.1 DNA-3-methyladenine glycosylase III [Streptococcus gallolyticus]